MPYAYQAGDNYSRGDYYRGDYYRGDPGILGDIFKGVKKIAKAAISVLPGPVGAVARFVTRTGRGSVAVGPGGGIGAVPVLQYQPPPFGSLPAQEPVGTMTPQGFLPGVCGMKGTRPNKSSYYKAVPGNPMQGILIPKGSVCVTTRRLNVANPRALRRSIRRVAGFAKLARRSIRWVSAKPPKGRPVAKRRGR